MENENMEMTVLHIEKQGDMSWVKAEGDPSDMADLVFRAAMDHAKIMEALNMYHETFVEVTNNIQNQLKHEEK